MLLRNYQQRAVSKTIYHLRENPILVAPTGSGKTVMGSEIVKRLDRPTLWIAHREELVLQAAASLPFETGIIKAGYEPNPNAQVQVASIQTLVRRTPPQCHLIVIDEAHHCAGESYKTIIRRYPDAPRIGLTATPFRLDGKGLGGAFGEIIVAATTKELVDRGYLHKPTVYSVSTPDLKGIRKTAGDYNLKQLEAVTNTTKLVGDIIATWKKRALAYKTVVFAVGIEHSKNIVAAFQAIGVAAEHVDGSTSKDERADILNRLRTGKTTVVSNCAVLTEGWDLPALECAVIARPTASLCLHLQMIGRIMRAVEGKNCVVLDHAGNHHIHGGATRHLEYSLEHSPAREPGEAVGLKTCPQCALMVEPSEMLCPECSYMFMPQSREIDEVDGVLVEFVEGSFEHKRDYLEMLESQRLAAGYKEGWSAYKYKDMFGDWPSAVRVDGELIMVDRKGDMEHKRMVWRGIEQMRRQKGYKPGWSNWRYKDYFGVWPQKVMSETDKLARKWVGAC